MNIASIFVEIDGSAAGHKLSAPPAPKPLVDLALFWPAVLINIKPPTGSLSASPDFAYNRPSIASTPKYY